MTLTMFGGRHFEKCPEKGSQGAKNLDPKLFCYIDPKGCEISKKLNFSTKISRDPVFEHIYPH